MPTPYDTALVRFVLKQLEKTERAEQVGAGPKGEDRRITARALAPTTEAAV